MITRPSKINQLSQFTSMALFSPFYTFQSLRNKPVSSTQQEGRLRISKSKIREAQCEIENLHGIDMDVREKYKEVMDLLRQDLTENERECKRLQEQIEWVSRRRAEIRDDVSLSTSLLITFLAQ